MIYLVALLLFSVGMALIGSAIRFQATLGKIKGDWVVWYSPDPTTDRREFFYLTKFNN